MSYMFGRHQWAKQMKVGLIHGVLEYLKAHTRKGIPWNSVAKILNRSVSLKTENFHIIW